MKFRRFIRSAAFVAACSTCAWAASAQIQPPVAQMHQSMAEALNRVGTDHDKFRMSVAVVYAPSSMATPYPPVVRLRYEDHAVPLFETDSATLNVQAKDVVKDLAHQIQKDGRIKSILVVGHTDQRGSVAHNKDLSERRALATAKSLMEAGIPTSQIHVIGVGKALLVTEGNDEKSMQRNRRVEFIVSNSSEPQAWPLDRQPIAGCTVVPGGKTAVGEACTNSSYQLRPVNPTGALGTSIAAIQLGAPPKASDLAEVVEIPRVDMSREQEPPPRVQMNAD